MSSCSCCSQSFLFTLLCVEFWAFFSASRILSMDRERSLNHSSRALASLSCGKRTHSSRSFTSSASLFLAASALTFSSSTRLFSSSCSFIQNLSLSVEDISLAGWIRL
uniref:Secreted protein n=1 Tax=Ixodes ricinus TaxID=34613 RepID=A0A6B0UHV8_IXORI